MENIDLEGLVRKCKDPSSQPSKLRRLVAVLGGEGTSSSAGSHQLGTYQTLAVVAHPSPTRLMFMPAARPPTSPIMRAPKWKMKYELSCQDINRFQQVMQILVAVLKR